MLNMYSNQTISVVGVGVIANGEWLRIKPVFEAVIRDKKLKNLIIFNCDTSNQNLIELYQKQYQNKINLINGSGEKDNSKILEVLISEAKKTNNDYILFLEKNCIPEDDIIDKFLDNYKYFNTNEKVVLIGNTVDIMGKETSFYNSTDKKKFKDGTLFDILSYTKIKSIIKSLLQIETENYTSKPIYPSQAFIGGGTFLPLGAVKNLEVQADTYPMFAADTDLAWNIKNIGYTFYQCKTPIIRRVAGDTEGTHHLFGMFSKNTSPNGVRNHIRNAILISRKHSKQNKIILLINIIIWTIGLIILGLGRSDSFKTFFERTWIIIRSAISGYKN